MPKVELDAPTFKILASDTRIDILKSLDQRKMTLEELTAHMKLKKATVHEHLSKLTDVELVKRHERPGHKWIYYDLSWKARCLLHPETGRIAVLIGATVVSFCAFIAGLFSYVYSQAEPTDGGLLLGVPDDVAVEFSFSPVLILALVGCSSFLLLLGITVWKMQKNKIYRI